MRSTRNSKYRNLVAGGIAIGTILSFVVPAQAEDVSQWATNSGFVGTVGSHVTVYGPVSGAGASVSIGSTGALASVSATSIAGGGYGGPAIAPKNIWQSSENFGAVSSMGDSIWTGPVTGKGASVGISATGAVSSVSATTIGSPVGASLGYGGRITQSAYNGGSVQTNGAVSVRVLSGVGASVGVSAMGATSVVSISKIR